MTHFHTKGKHNRYLYVRECKRVNGKPTIVSQTYIGTPEKVRALKSKAKTDEAILKSQEFGALWLANQADDGIDLVNIIDSIIPYSPKETGPSIGEYFLFSAFNRMIEPKSKNELSKWYKNTAVQHIRPVKIKELTSCRYWEKWDRVSENALKEIAKIFFAKVWELEKPETDCVVFDTTNYYTFMATQTKSELSKRGKNKAGRHNLRQIGLALLVARGNQLPLYYHIYPGNLHDSKEFKKIMDEMFGIICGFDETEKRLTVIIDKGMNSSDNFSWIDSKSQIHFITTYSTYFAESLASLPLEQFECADIKKNRILQKRGNPEKCILSYRTEGEYWGKERSVIVVYNPATAHKQNYSLERKLEKLRQDLKIMCEKVKNNAPQWKKQGEIRKRYIKLCNKLHISSELYEIKFRRLKKQLKMDFKENTSLLKEKRNTFGRSIIITDNIDWTTSEIVEAHLSRWEVENQFRQSKNNSHVSVMPLRHWTDSKIRCHLFSCVVALTYLRRIELKFKKEGLSKSANDAMNIMRNLDSILSIPKGGRKPRRRMETPDEEQALILSSFGYTIDENWVLQK